MKKHLVTKERLTKDFAEIIRSQIGFTNGWRIDDKSYQEQCELAAKRIIKILKRRKILSGETRKDFEKKNCDHAVSFDVSETHEYCPMCEQYIKK